MSELILRDRNSSNGAVAEESLRFLGDLRCEVADTYANYLASTGRIINLETSGGASYRNYVIGAVSLHDAVEGNPLKEGKQYFIAEHDEIDEYSPGRVMAFDMLSKTGLQREFGDKTEDYDLEDRVYYGIGQPVLRRMIDGASNPELSEIADICLEKFNPSEHGLAIVEDDNRAAMYVDADFDSITDEQIQELRNIYNQVAYPDLKDVSILRRNFDLDYGVNVKEQLADSPMSVGVRDDTKELACPKFELAYIRDTNAVRISMYLNYSIMFGGLHAHFNEDVEMAMDFAGRAEDYLKEHGVPIRYN